MQGGQRVYFLLSPLSSTSSYSLACLLTYSYYLTDRLTTMVSLIVAAEQYLVKDIEGEHPRESMKRHHVKRLLDLNADFIDAESDVGRRAHHDDQLRQRGAA